MLRGMACCKNLSRAFAKLVKEYNILWRRENKSKPAGFVISQLKPQRRFPTTTYEVMDEEEAMKFKSYFAEQKNLVWAVNHNELSKRFFSCQEYLIL